MEDGGKRNDKNEKYERELNGIIKIKIKDSG
jgi:hypothetical protein